MVTPTIALLAFVHVIAEFAVVGGHFKTLFTRTIITSWVVRADRATASIVPLTLINVETGAVIRAHVVA